jgi:hypothetical protein
MADNILDAMNQAGGASSPATETAARQSSFLIAICMGLIVLGASPIFLGASPAPTAQFFNSSPGWQMAGRFFLVAILVGAVLLTGWLDQERGAAKAVRFCGFVLVAALLTDVHFYTRDVFQLPWQLDQFNAILLHTCQPPDQYRFLPQGILWWMVAGNGDFFFSYLAYRFLFTFLVCQAIYKFARLYLAPRDAVIVVLCYSAFYPLSTRYYNGNLLDPMSHAVMLAALTCCRRGEFRRVFWLFALGMFIKETMLVIVPCYYLMNLETLRLRDPRVLGRLSLLGFAGVALFLVCRMPFHFNYDFKTLNRTEGTMFFSNLGFSGGLAGSPVSVFQRHLHPILFIFMWLPLIILRREFLPRSLFWTALYFAAAIYLTNLFFSWNYESRNFVPVLVVLLVCTMIIVNRLIAEPKPAPA